MKWDKLATEISLKKTVKSLTDNGIEVIITDNKEDARNKLLKLIPKGSEVMEVSSTTLDQIGVTKEIDESGKYISLRKIIRAENDETKRHELRTRAALAPFIIGSVHAVTEDGKIMTASQSGSQLPGYALNAQNVIWVVGTQKIVKNLDEAFKRLYEYTLPLEDARMKKAYDVGSYPNKILIIQKERQIGRIKLIFVKENLGF